MQNRKRCKIYTIFSKSALYQFGYCCVNIHICYTMHFHGYNKCVCYYFINFFSHFSLISLPSPPPQKKTLPNHHSITTTTTHVIPITKSTKNKENQTQNQTFNVKLNNLEPKTNFQQKTYQPTPKPKSKPSSPLPWRACCFLCLWRACCCH